MQCPKCSRPSVLKDEEFVQMNNDSIIIKEIHECDSCGFVFSRIGSKKLEQPTNEIQEQNVQEVQTDLLNIEPASETIINLLAPEKTQKIKKESKDEEIIEIFDI